MAFWGPFFPFGLKLKSLLRRHVMTFVQTFLSEIKTISSSFMKIMYIFGIFFSKNHILETSFPSLHFFYFTLSFQNKIFRETSFNESLHFIFFCWESFVEIKSFSDRLIKTVFLIYYRVMLFNVYLLP